MKCRAPRSIREEYDDLIRPVLIPCKVIAVWPLRDGSSASEKLFRACHLSCALFMLLLMCVALAIDVVYNMGNLDEMIECALLESAFYLGTIRVVVFSLHQKDMLYLIEIMRNDWLDSSDEERAILRAKCLFPFRLAKCFMIMTSFVAVLFAFIPILEACFLSEVERTLPFHGRFYVNQTASPVYEYLYVFNVLCGWTVCVTIVSATGFNLVAIMHGSAKFALLRRRLEMLGRNDPDVDRTIADCVRRHQDAITFAEVLEGTINILVLGQFIISTGLICFAGFQITAMMEDKARLMKYTAFLNAAVLELFMFSMGGNDLIEESDAVGESAYRSDWIGGTFGRSLQLVMMRSRIPSRITAAKFYSTSLRSFSQVLSTAFSYMMVLTTVNEE